MGPLQAPTSEGEGEGGEEGPSVVVCVRESGPLQTAEHGRYLGTAY